jgi:hypothetical protein
MPTAVISAADAVVIGLIRDHLDLLRRQVPQ